MFSTSFNLMSDSNSMEQNPSQEANNRSAFQEILPFMEPEVIDVFTRPYRWSDQSRGHA
jgi:hypothetical protein